MSSYAFFYYSSWGFIYVPDIFQMITQKAETSPGQLVSTEWDEYYLIQAV